MQTKGGEDLGISDIIAGFIQQELDQAGGALELQRADLAQRFNCVPSQINYVMSTRFSPEHGYIVESRRGGGGYIRITRVPGGPPDAADARYQQHRRQAGRGQRTAIAQNLSSPRLSATSWDRRCCPPPAHEPCRRRRRRTATRCAPIYSSKF